MSEHNSPTPRDSTGLSLKSQLQDFFSGVPRPWFQVFFPALSVLTITLAVYFSISTGKHKAEETLLTIAHQALRANNLSQIEDVLEKLILVKGLDQKQLLDNYRSLIGIISDLRQDKLSAAVRKVELLSPASFRGLISRNRETTVLYNKIEADFNTLVSDYQKFEVDSKAAPAKIEQLLKQANRSLNDMNNLTFEYASLFSLEPTSTGKISFDDKTGTLKIEKIYLYKSGTLAGLPSLKGMPDGLMNRVILREKLEQLGGKINLGGTDIAKEFEEKITKFRQEFRIFDATINQLEMQYQKMQKLEGSSTFAKPEYTNRLATNLALLIVKSLQN